MNSGTCRDFAKQFHISMFKVYTRVGDQQWTGISKLFLLRDSLHQESIILVRIYIIGFSLVVKQAFFGDIQLQPTADDRKVIRRHSFQVIVHGNEAV